MNEPKDFSEFADGMMRDLHDGLLRGGADKMREALYHWLPYYVRWNKEKTERAKGE